jgi:hypothetical protein
MTDSHGTPLEAEPQTPMWLPALGAALFVSAALWWAVTPSAPVITADDAAPSAAVSVAAAAPAPSALPPAARLAQPLNPAANAAPVPSGIPSGMHRLNPAIEDRLQKAHQGMVPGGPGRHP